MSLQGIATNGFFVFAPFPVTDAFAGFLSGQPVFFLQGLWRFHPPHSRQRAELLCAGHLQGLAAAHA